MVLEVGVELRAPVVHVRSSRPSPSRTAQEELRARRGGVHVARLAEHRARVGEGARSPARSTRSGACRRAPGAPAARGRRRAGALTRRASRARARAHQDVRALEVAPLGGAEAARRRLVGELAERLAQLGQRPDVEAGPPRPRCPRPAPSTKPPSGVAHLAQHVVERLLARRAGSTARRRPGSLQVGAREQRVVVEHLLEVRHRASARRPSSGRSRRRPGRACRRRHRASVCSAIVALARGASRNSSTDGAGTSARRRTRRARVVAAAQRARRRRPATLAIELGPDGCSARGAAQAGEDRARPLGSISSRWSRHASAMAVQHLGQPASPGAAPAGSRCRRRTAPAVGRAGTRSAASRRGRSSPAPRPCRSRRRPGAPRGRP